MTDKLIATLTAERDAARGEAEQLRSNLNDALKVNFAFNVKAGEINEARQQRDAARSEVERLTRELRALKDWALTDLKPIAPAAHYQCNACDERMRRWQDFEEYQHDGCGGLVELAQVIAMRAERDAALAEVERLKTHVAFNDEEYVTMRDVLRAERCRLRIADSLLAVVALMDSDESTDRVKVFRSCTPSLAPLFHDSDGDAIYLRDATRRFVDRTDGVLMRVEVAAIERQTAERICRWLRAMDDSEADRAAETIESGAWKDKP